MSNRGEHFKPANLRRSWVSTGVGLGSKANDETTTPGFSLMSYNVLADCHIRDTWYPYCPEGYRKMSDRHRRLMVEIGHHNPDVICLQEVGSDYFAVQLYPAMFSLGYLGTYMNKVRGIKEGEATFYKREQFQLVEQQGFSFKQLVAKECKQAKLSTLDQAELIAYTDQDHLVLLTKLQDIQSKQTVSIGNTHLLFDDYKNIDIITMQAGLAINALIEFAGGVDEPHVLCGDFNQEPNMTGYQLMHDGMLDTDGKQFIRQWPIQLGDGKKSLVDVLPGCFTHASTLQSAYKTVMGLEVPFSNYEDYLGVEWSPDTKLPLGEATEKGDITQAKRPRKAYITDPKKYGQKKFVAALDYQWFSCGTLRCLATLEMVDEDEIKPFYACPNEEFPSDHLSICSKYAFKGGA